METGAKCNCNTIFCWAPTVCQKRHSWFEPSRGTMKAVLLLPPFYKWINEKLRGWGQTGLLSSHNMEFTGNSNIAVTLDPTTPSLPSVSEGSLWQLIHLENPFRIFLRGFLTFIAPFHVSDPWFEHSALVHVLANSFSISKSGWVSQCHSSWELPGLKSSHFYLYIWDKDGQYIASTHPR